MNCQFCQNDLFKFEDRNDYSRYICKHCTYTMFDINDKEVIRYHISLDNSYSIRVSYKTKTVRVYFEKDKYGITPALLTIPFDQNPNINPSNAEQKIKTILTFS